MSKENNNEQKTNNKIEQNDANVSEQNTARVPDNDAPVRAPLPKGVKIYLGIAIPLLLLVIAALIYVIVFVKPPETNAGQSTLATETTTTETTTAEATTTTTVETTTTTTTTTAATTTTTTTTEATTTTKSEEEQVQDVLADLTASEEAIAQSDPKQREGVYTILLLGLDSSKNSLADTIMMLTLDANEKKINVFSIPRDLISTSAAGNYAKINASYVKGIDRTIEEVYNIIGIRPNRYVTVEYEGFEKLIDALGGIEEDVFMDMQYVDHSANLTIDIKEGTQVLDGENALKYVRFRSGYAAADLKRIEIQQGFLTKVFNKLKEPATILKVPELVNIFKENVETDMSVGEIIWFATHFYDMDSENIVCGKVPTHSQRVDGQDYEVPYEGTLLTRLNEGGYNPYEEVIFNVNLTIPPEETTAATNADGSVATTAANFQITNN